MFGGGPLEVVEVYGVMRVEPPLWISVLKRRPELSLSLPCGDKQEGSCLLARKRALIKNLAMLDPGLGFTSLKYFEK